MKLYRILCGNAKLHWCNNIDICGAVSKDLRTRLGDELSIDVFENRNDVFIDFGGMISTKWKTIEVKINDTVYEWWPHHTTILFNKLTEGLKNIREGNYIKIHQEYIVHCIAVDDAQKLLKDITDNIEKYENIADVNFKIMFDKRLIINS